MMIAGAVAATVAGALVVPSAAGAAAAKGIPHVSVHLGKGVSTSRTHLYPGRVTFDVHSSKGQNSVQLASLAKGYSLAQAGQDIGKAFGGDVTAVRTVDKKVHFKGGVAASPKHPGHVTVYLSAGTYYLVNQNTNKAKTITVSGKAVNRKTVRTNSRITMLTYGFSSLPRLHRSGTMRLSNVSDQPHFLVLVHILPGTTNKQLMKAFQNESNSQPKFVLKGEVDSAILSPYKTQAFTYKLPAGTYVMACFWPDDDTGMPHAAMGMFKKVVLY